MGPESREEGVRIRWRGGLGALRFTGPAGGVGRPGREGKGWAEEKGAGPVRGKGEGEWVGLRSGVGLGFLPLFFLFSFSNNTQPI